jgi:hypothetical protein
VAVAVAGLAIGVAAILVEPAAMGEGSGGEKRCEKSSEKSFHDRPPKICGMLLWHRRIILQPEMVIRNIISW